MKRRAIAFALLALAGCEQQISAPPPPPGAITLPRDPVERAEHCAATGRARLTAARHNRTDVTLPSADFQETLYYDLMAARARYGDRLTYISLAQMGRETVERRRANPALGQDRPDETLALCRNLYPAAAGTMPVSLPADDSDAALQCASLARFWPITTHGVSSDDGPREAQGDRVVEALAGRMQGIFAGRGARSEDAMERIYEQAFARSVELGRPDKVIDACEARFAAPR